MKRRLLGVIAAVSMLCSSLTAFAGEPKEELLQGEGFIGETNIKNDRVRELTDTDGREVTTRGEEGKIKVIISGRVTGCTLTIGAVDYLAGRLGDRAGVEIITRDVDGRTSEELKQMMSESPFAWMFGNYDKAHITGDYNANNDMWHVINILKINAGTFPLVIVVDQENDIRYCSMSKSQDTLAPLADYVEKLLEEMAETLRNAKPDEEADREYAKEQAGEIRKAMATEESVVRELLSFEQPVTANNLMAAGLLKNERGKAAERLYGLAEKTGDVGKLDDAIEGLYESMTDAGPMNKAYGKLGETYIGILDNVLYGIGNVGKIDIKEINNLYKQITLSSNMAKEENYEVPVKIDGEITSINLKIVHGREESGKVMLSMETETYGKAAAQFTVSAHKSGEYHMSGYIACENKEAAGMLENTKERLKKALERSDIKVINLSIVYNSGLDMASVSKAAADAKEEAAADGGKQKVSTKKLYDAAKIFIGHIQKGEGAGYENKL